MRTTRQVRLMRFLRLAAHLYHDEDVRVVGTLCRVTEAMPLTGALCLCSGRGDHHGRYERYGKRDHYRQQALPNT